MGSVRQARIHDAQERGSNRRVGVDDHDRVVGFIAFPQPLQQPSEGRTLATVVRSDPVVHLGAEALGDLDRRVGAVVGDDVDRDECRRVVDRSQARQGLRDHSLLVVGRHQDQEAVGRCRAERGRGGTRSFGEPRRRGQDRQVTDQRSLRDRRNAAERGGEIAETEAAAATILARRHLSLSSPAAAGRSAGTAEDGVSFARWR